MFNYEKLTALIIVGIVVVAAMCLAHIGPFNHMVQPLLDTGKSALHSFK